MNAIWSPRRITLGVTLASVKIDERMTKKQFLLMPERSDSSCLWTERTLESISMEASETPTVLETDWKMTPTERIIMTRMETETMSSMRVKAERTRNAERGTMKREEDVCEEVRIFSYSKGDGGLVDVDEGAGGSAVGGRSEDDIFGGRGADEAGA